MDTKVDLKVKKITEEELKEYREYIQELTDVIQDGTDEDISIIAKKIPMFSYLITLNLGILLDNYQDDSSEFLEHPKWIKELIK